MNREILKRKFKRALTHHIPADSEYEEMRNVAERLAEDLANTVADYVTSRRVKTTIPAATYSQGASPSVIPAPAPVIIIGEVQE